MPVSSRKMRVLAHFTIHMVEIIQLYSIIYISTTYVVGIPSSSVFQPYVWLDTISYIDEIYEMNHTVVRFSGAFHQNSVNFSEQ